MTSFFGQVSSYSSLLHSTHSSTLLTSVTVYLIEKMTSFRQSENIVL